MSLLEVENLSVSFPVRRGLLQKTSQSVQAVKNLSFTIDRGETLGLVGESGCGKTTVGRTVTRLVEPTSGRIVFAGEEISRLHGSALREQRRHFQIIFQDPYSSLDPRFTAGEIIGEALDIHRLAPDRASRRKRIVELLNAVGLDGRHESRYPHQFSGGQRQRLGIARALAVKPQLIVCDEPVSALDVSVQAQVVNLLQDLQEQMGLAYLFIAHDLAVVEHISRRVMVMYLGQLMELAPAAEIIGRPRHPYTQALISAVPVLDPASRRSRILLGGDVPSPANPPTGCPFHPRCPVAIAKCHTDPAPLRQLAPGHWAACHLAS